MCLAEIDKECGSASRKKKYRTVPPLGRILYKERGETAGVNQSLLGAYQLTLLTPLSPTPCYIPSLGTYFP